MPAPHRVEPVRTRPVAKPGGGTRILAHLGPRDAATWERLGSRIRPLVERRLATGVLDHRTDSRPLGARLAHARRLAARWAERREVISTDIRSFYPSVDPPVLFRMLRRVEADRSDAALAADMTERWGSEGTIAGLPVGPPASAVLANAVLVPVDDALLPPFLRWVDDYLLPDGALDRFDEALASIGLGRSARKTAHGLHGLWTPRGSAGYPAVSPGTR